MENENEFKKLDPTDLGEIEKTEKPKRKRRKSKKDEPDDLVVYVPEKKKSAKPKPKKRLLAVKEKPSDKPIKKDAVERLMHPGYVNSKHMRIAIENANRFRGED